LKKHFNEYFAFSQNDKFEDIVHLIQNYPEKVISLRIEKSTTIGYNLDSTSNSTRSFAIFLPESRVIFVGSEIIKKKDIKSFILKNRHTLEVKNILNTIQAFNHKITGISAQRTLICFTELII